MLLIFLVLFLFFFFFFFLSFFSHFSLHDCFILVAISSSMLPKDLVDCLVISFFLST